MSLDHDAVLLAMRGLWTAYERHRAHCREHTFDAGLINISAVEAANWICAIDEQLREEAGVKPLAWEQQHTTDPDRQYVPGVRYVRDRHMHQVVTSTRRDDADFFRNFQLSAGVVWRPVGEIPEGSPRHRSQDTYKVRRSAYEQHLQHRPTWHALTLSGQWLTSALAACGVPVTVPWNPVF